MDIDDILYADDTERGSGKESETLSYENGCLVVRIASVKKYAKFVGDNFGNIPEYVYRGQANSTWCVESSFSKIRQGYECNTRESKMS